MKCKTINRPFEIKMATDDSGRFSGYASVFGEMDYGRDIVMSGAFTKSLARHKARGSKVPVLWQHDQQNPIGVYDVIEEDSKGLQVEGMLVRGVQQADEAHLLAKAGALTGISIGYIAQDARPGKQKGSTELHVVDLWEASLVTFPMLDSARVTDVKSLSELVTVRDVEDWLRDAKGLTPHEAKAVISCIKADRQQRDVAEKAGKIDYAALRRIINS